jgi:hypothetical protein
MGNYSKKKKTEWNREEDLEMLVKKYFSSYVIVSGVLILLAVVIELVKWVIK